MTSENIIKERWDQLGLGPPMELAESSGNNRDNNGVYKCFLPSLQKFIVMLLLTSFGIGTYVLLLKISENYDSARTTEIIIITGNNEIRNMTTASMEAFLKLKNETHQQKPRSEPKVKRKRRHTISSSDSYMEDSNINLDDEKLQKARDIILKHDVLCNNENQQEICKDFVNKLKAIVHNDEMENAGNPSRIKLKVDDHDHHVNVESKAKQTAITPADLIKREALSNTNFDNILKTVPNINVEAREARPYTNPNLLSHSHSVSPHHLTDSCLLARLLKHNYPHAKEIYDPTSEYLAPHYEHPLMPQSRYMSPVVHAPYLEERDMDLQRHKIHPQDVAIVMTFLTPKPEMTAKESASNSSQETICAVGMMPCLSGDACVEEKQWCDGNVDCTDVSDEARCTCKSRVDKSRICDGYFDCPFGEDEMGCYGCSDTMFSCEDLDVNSQSTCFTKEQRCNNVVDCPNHKDEIECNMLAPSLLKKPLFAVSNTEGFLHRNFKGDWYAVCKNPYMWAHDACRRETGLIIRPPLIQLVPIDPMLKIDYLDAGPGGLLKTSNTCMNSSAVYVICPDLLCGTRVQSTPQLFRENTAIENHLFGRNKRFLFRNHPYPLMFYGNRLKRNVDEINAKTNQENEFDPPEGDLVDTMRNKRTESRVVGGKPSQPAAWPWMVAVYRNGMFHCGGVVITHSWVISAAHCVHKFWDYYYEVQVGMLRRFSFSPQEQSHKVTHVIVNQHYSQTDMKNDLSLLRVEPAIQYSRWVRPICLPSPDTAGPDWLWGPSPGTVCTAVGWGATKEHGPDPDHMREVEVPIWSNCKHREDKAGHEICAGFVEGGKDACQGDSGGPLLCRNPLNSQQWYMAGIVSHGDGCARKDEPGVYTRVSLFVKWIKYHISSKTLPKFQPIQECPGFKCETGISKCLPNKRKCDKIVDCLDGEDETKCEFVKTVSTLAENIFTDPKSPLAELLESKEVQTESTIKQNNNQIQEETIVQTKNDSSTSTNENDKNVSTIDHKNTNEHQTEIYDMTTPSIEDNNNNLGSKESTDSDKPDFEHASPLEMINDNSQERRTYSEETATSDPQSSTEIAAVAESRGDTETIAIDFSKESMESRSSILERSTETTTQKQATEPLNLSNETVEDTTDIENSLENKLDTSTSASLQNIVIEPIDNDESTTRVDLLKDLQDSHFHDEVENTTEFTIKPVPDSEHAASNQETTTAKVVNNDNNNATISNHHNDSSVKKLTDFEKESDALNQIEDMISSELEPAKIRRKHRNPSDFECRRIAQIIPYNLRCDRNADCEDGTDELDCTCTDFLSTFNEKLICDGVIDCADGQDETDCFSCPEDHFLCKRSRICLPEKHVCNGKPECPLAEDELNCFALTNGKEIEFDMDERPLVNLEGYLTKKHVHDWHVVCDDKLSLEEQEQAATHICRYLGFSSANKYNVKYINLNENEIAARSLDNKRTRRDTIERLPIHFAYRQESEENATARHTIIKEPQVIKEQCVPNITKTCKSLYVFCDNSLFTNLDGFENNFLRNTEPVSNHAWPWIAKVFVEGDYRCTGVLVNMSWVLVSDSCLWDSTLSHHYITVVLGSHRTLEMNGMHEQVYKVDSKKDVYRSKATLLHLKKPARYSNVVKPMVVSSSYSLEQKSTCVAVGQDNENNTISVFLEETSENCHPSNRCFKRKSEDRICPPDVTSHRHWAGIISCHTDQGWYPAATFVDGRGECGLGDHINATDIENLKNEIKYHYGVKKSPSLIDKEGNDNCAGVRCGRGRCVQLLQVCDGVKDCEDGNDESESSCNNKHNICDTDPYHKGCECSVGQMKCRNGKCISKQLFRDGNNDCGDGTDEPGQTICKDYLATVTPSRLCDGVLHCQDRSDEDPIFCKCFAKKTYSCGSKFGVEHCVAPDTVCDGVRDCPNGEDEQTCMALTAPHGTPIGTGQVIVRSHGVWHSKCYATVNHTKSELEAICAQLGYISGHAKQIKELKNIHPYNNLVIDSFKEVILNNNTRIKMRNTHQPLAKAVFDAGMQNCYPVFIECR